MKVNVRYQKWDPDSNTPYDYNMNEKNISFDSLASVPVIGDHIRFLDDTEGEVGTFRVRSRLLTHATHPITGDLLISADVVVEEADNVRELVNEPKKKVVDDMGEEANFWQLDDIEE